MEDKSSIWTPARGPFNPAVGARVSDRTLVFFSLSSQETHQEIHPKAVLTSCFKKSAYAFFSMQLAATLRTQRNKCHALAQNNETKLVTPLSPGTKINEHFPRPKIVTIKLIIPDSLSSMQFRKFTNRVKTLLLHFSARERS